jgi:hypothetical protein
MKGNINEKLHRQILKEIFDTKCAQQGRAREKHLAQFPNCGSQLPATCNMTNGVILQPFHYDTQNVFCYSKRT